VEHLVTTGLIRTRRLRRVSTPCTYPSPRPERLAPSSTARGRPSRAAFPRGFAPFPDEHLGGLDGGYGACEIGMAHRSVLVDRG